MVERIETSENSGAFNVWPRVFLHNILAYRVHGMNVKFGTRPLPSLHIAQSEILT